LRNLLEACVINAQSLVLEAKLLHEGGHFARSLLLAYFATEEAAKTAQLGATIVNEALDRPIDWRIFWCRWNDHERKSLTASHTQVVSESLAAHLASGAPLVERGVPYIVPYENETLARNARKARSRRIKSLYVDWQDATRAVIDPASITAHEAAGAIKVAEDHASTARGQFDLLFSSPATFDAVLEAERTGRPWVTVLTDE
jgi:AbiV family abortive infection protein